MADLVIDPAGDSIILYVNEVTPGVITVDGVQALTNKTYNGLTLTMQLVGYSISGGTTSKTLTVGNTLALEGTDGATLDIGNGGALGSAAFTAASAYASATAVIAGQFGGTGVANTGKTITIGGNVNLAGAYTQSGAFSHTFVIPSTATYTFPTGSSTLAQLGANTFTGAQIYGDQAASRAMFLDCGHKVAAKGNSSITAQAYDYTAGSVQTSTCTGAHTISTSNWPPTGNLGELLIVGTNFGAYAITWPTVNWIKPDGTTTTSISTYLAANTGRTAFQASGIDHILLWTRDAGATIHGKLI